MSEKNLGKILAIILATASLTACGGGGGGGGGGGSTLSTPRYTKSATSGYS